MLLNIIANVNESLSPEERFARAFRSTNRLENAPVWGCPIYVLQPTLQDGKKLPKWQPRSRRGQFVGWSTLHASNVALVRNLNTGRISPQFHVVFDNWFETVTVDDENEKKEVIGLLVCSDNVNYSTLIENYELSDFSFIRN